MCIKGINIEKISSISYDGDMNKGLAVLVAKHPDNPIDINGSNFDIYEVV